MAIVSLLCLLCREKAPRVHCAFLPRDDAGQFDSSRIGPKKRLTYETGTETRLRGRRRLEFAHWPRETTFQAPRCIVSLRKKEVCGC